MVRLIELCDFKLPWRRKWQSTPALLPGKSHGRRSLLGSQSQTQLSDFTFTFLSLMNVLSSFSSYLDIFLGRMDDSTRERERERISTLINSRLLKPLFSSKLYTLTKITVELSKSIAPKD